MDFWKTTADNVGGPLTQETWDAAMRALVEDQEAYYRDYPHDIVIFPASMVKAKEMP